MCWRPTVSRTLIRHSFCQMFDVTCVSHYPVRVISAEHQRSHFRDTHNTYAQHYTHTHGPLYRFTRQGDTHERLHTIVKERALPTGFRSSRMLQWRSGAEEEMTILQSGHGEMVLKTGDRASEVSQNFGLSSRE